MNIAVVLLLTWIAQYLPVQCCYNNKRVGFCPKDGVLHEKMCPGVKPLSCKPWSLRCACTKKAHRRQDGECVTSMEECAKWKKKLPKKPLQTEGKGVADHPPVIPESPPPVTPVTPTTPEQKEVPPPSDPYSSSYYSGGSHGCPSNIETCAESCRALGYPHSNCDRYIISDCYCYGQRLNTQSENPGKGKVRNQVPWPYGKVLRSGKLIQQLTESYGCSSGVEKCFDECEQRGLEGAFCGVYTPHYCFCEAFLPPGDWEYESHGDESQYEEAEAGPPSFPSKENCYQLCTTQRHSGGFCEGDPAVCHCYVMYPYNLHTAKHIDNELKKLQSRNYEVKKSDRCCRVRKK
uniref:Putative secreted protein n=1 Tax=Amblyomma triste TaxID=251400 RepID=A0A023G5Z9_AMBTT